MPLYPTTNRLSIGGEERILNENSTPSPYETTWNDSSNNFGQRAIDSSNRSFTTVHNNQRALVPQNQPLNPNQYYVNTKYYSSLPPSEAIADRSIIEYHQKGSDYTRLPMKSVDLTNQVRYPMPIFHDYGQSFPYTMYKNKMFEKPLSYEDSLIRDHYPKKFAITHSIIMIILSITVFVLQIIMIIYQSPYYFIGGGLWSGLYFLLCASLALVLTKNHNYSLFIVTILLYLLGVLLVAVGGLIVVNSMAIYSFLNCYTSPCATSVNPYNVTNLAIGCVIIIMGVIFLLKMQCSVNSRVRVNF